MIKRRDFIKRSLQASGALALGVAWTSCEKPRKISGTIGSPNFKVGHLLRTVVQTQPKEIIKTDCVIIGGGVSGLAASRKLKQAQVEHLLLELEDKPGGNAHAGSTTAGAFPWGAHYITIPTLHDTDYLDFLKSCNVILDFKNGLPVLNEYHVCFDIKERLFIHGEWQEGLVPLQGIKQNELVEIKKLTELIEFYKNAKGKDGLPAFTLPLAYSSKDPAFLALDKISFSDWLKEKKLSSKPLLWYINYCMADDYGGSAENVSAWAGLHYFASHQAKANNVDDDAVITWPEGNYWLIKQLQTQAGEHKTNQLVYHVVDKQGFLEVYVYDVKQEKAVIYQTKQIISCVPQYVNQFIFRSIARNTNADNYYYSPWLVANITLNTAALYSKGVELAWDNVIYENNSLGYVHANHQNINQQNATSLSNITYYKPMVNENPVAVREKMLLQSYQDWYDGIIMDLKIPHPAIEKDIHQVDIWHWAHGMIRPSVGFITRDEAVADKNSYQNKIHFAHTDLAGISVFEEGFNLGTQAAIKVIRG